ncbi:amidohydrolase family protein [Kitasatospora sp. NPDC048540]|uniref:amidohydrolase family protein n=1 Tax=unclassified Kitasatospora TaxID=2633591 RepID=UPI000539F95B|nr:amidohydrolase family protein [Kitasatospora sp. MBT63]
MYTDVHAHLWSDAYLDRLETYGRTDTGGQRGLGAGDGERELAERFARNDAAGIGCQILSVAPQVPHFADRNHAVSAARHANNLYATVTSQHPDRFAAFAALPMPHLDAALEELTRALDGLDMAGVTLTTDVLGRALTDPGFVPLFEELDRRGSVLYLHPSGQAAGSPLIADGRMRWMVGAPVEDTVAAMDLLLNGYPARFPRLRIVVSHLGGALPMLLPRADEHLRWEAPEVAEPPTSSARRLLYDTVAHGNVPAIRLAARALGADRLLLGTDFPYQSGDQLVRAVVSVRTALPPAEAEAALSRAATLFR